MVWNMARLADHIRISPTKPDEGVDWVNLDGAWFTLLTPVDRWPGILRREFEQDAKHLFRKAGSREPSGDVALCSMVQSCGLKRPDETENRACRYYAWGICCQASACLGTISFRMLAAFAGLPESEVRRVHTQAMAALTDQILADPVLREVLEDIGLGKVLLGSSPT